MEGPLDWAALFFVPIIRRSGATRQFQEHQLDCFATLAMTRCVLLVLVLLGACRDQRPPQPTSEQSQQLNDAEDMLNNMAGNEEGPEANASSPSNSSD
jgi:hypothetical protein